MKDCDCCEWLVDGSCILKLQPDGDCPIKREIMVWGCRDDDFKSVAQNLIVSRKMIQPLCQT